MKNNNIIKNNNNNNKYMYIHIRIMYYICIIYTNTRKKKPRLGRFY